MAERILSCRTILEYGGFGPGWSEPADDMESVAYNTLPSTLSDDGRGVRYYHVLNMPSCAEWMSTGFECIDNGGAITPGPDAGFGCCRSNFHFAWPRFVQSMWMEENAAAGEGLVAVAYGPCTVSNRVATVVEGGDYPFGDRVTMRITRTCDRAWRLRYRIPRWCDAKRVTVSVNGKSQPVTGELTRKWSVGDELEFVFPAEVTVERGVYDSIAVRRGALVYALKIEAKVTEKPTEANRKGWPVREYDAVSPWNYALVFDGRRLEAEYVPPSDLTGNVFAHGRAVSSIRARAYRTDYAGWGQRRPPAHFSARIVEPPPSPLAADRHASAAERITLIPLGATQIRITLFPWTGGM